MWKKFDKFFFKCDRNFVIYDIIKSAVRSYKNFFEMIYYKKLIWIKLKEVKGKIIIFFFLIENIIKLCYIKR